MEKIQRKIFTPDVLADRLINGLMKDKNMTVSDIVNSAIVNTFTPKNYDLKRESNFLFDKIINNLEITQSELKSVLARCVTALKDAPIESPAALESIMHYFMNPVNGVKRYDYVLIADTDQDEKLRNLKAILGTIDDQYPIGNHEFGENAREVFRNWNILCEYPEVYSGLATIIDCEEFYCDMTVFEAVYLISVLDAAIQESTIQPKKECYPISLTLDQRFRGYKYEIMMYYTDNGYAALSKDNSFDLMPQSILSYYKDTCSLSAFPHATEEDVKNIMELELRGRILFRRLAN